MTKTHLLPYFSPFMVSLLGKKVIYALHFAVSSPVNSSTEIWLLTHYSIELIIAKISESPDCQAQWTLLFLRLYSTLFIKLALLSHGLSSLFLFIPSPPPLSIRPFLLASKHWDPTEVTPGFILFLLYFLLDRSCL